MSTGDVLGSIATEAAKGAAIGSVVPGVGTAVGAVVGGIKGAVSGRKKSKYNDEINKQITAMKEGKLGMTAAQKSQEKRGVHDDAQRAAAAAVGDITEMGPAGGGGYQGQQTGALIDASKGAAEAAAQAAVQVDTNSAVLAENQRKEAMNAMREQAGLARVTEQKMSHAAGAGLETMSESKGLDPDMASTYSTIASMLLAV